MKYGGTQARRTDRAHLRLIHAEAGQPEPMVPPHFWLGVMAALALGAALMPLAYCGAWLAMWIAGVEN